MSILMAKSKPGPKPNPNRVRSAVVNVRSRPEWKGWIEEFATHEGVDVSELIDDAMLNHARKCGFKMPPQR